MRLEIRIRRMVEMRGIYKDKQNLWLRTGNYDGGLR